MTHPDLFEQAVAEAEAKQATEVAQKSREKVEEPFKYFEVVHNPVHQRSLAGGLKFIAQTQDISIQDVSEWTIQQWSGDFASASAHEADLMVVRPRNEMTHEEMLTQMEKDGLQPANLCDLMSSPWTKPTSENSQLWATASRTIDLGLQSAYLNFPAGGIPKLGLFAHSDSSVFSPNLHLLVRLSPRASQRVHQYLDGSSMP